MLPLYSLYNTSHTLGRLQPQDIKSWLDQHQDRNLPLLLHAPLQNAWVTLQQTCLNTTHCVCVYHNILDNSGWHSYLGTHISLSLVNSEVRRRDTAIACHRACTEFPSESSLITRSAILNNSFLVAVSFMISNLFRKCGAPWLRQNKPSTAK